MREHMQAVLERLKAAAARQVDHSQSNLAQSNLSPSSLTASADPVPGAGVPRVKAVLKVRRDPSRDQK